MHQPDPLNVNLERIRRALLPGEARPSASVATHAVDPPVREPLFQRLMFWRDIR